MQFDAGINGLMIIMPTSLLYSVPREHITIERKTFSASSFVDSVHLVFYISAVLLLLSILIYLAINNFLLR